MDLSWYAGLQLALLPLLLLPLPACGPATDKARQGADSGGDGGDTGEDPDTAADPGSLLLYGYVKQASTRGPLEGVRAFSLDREGEEALSDAEGLWTMEVEDRPWIRFRNEAEGFLPMEAWIDPREAVDPAYPYPYTMGSAADLEGLLAGLGAERVEGAATLFVDAIDPRMRDIGGAHVSIDMAYTGPFREHAPGEWDNEPLTTSDRSDLLFANVQPGPVSIVVAGPRGSSCETPPGVELHADEITQVSVYCDEPAQ